MASFMKNKKFLLAVLLLLSVNVFAQQKTWVDSLDNYVRESYMKTNKYHWTWQRASLLYSMLYQYETAPEANKTTYLNYIKGCMDDVYGRANGKSPNAVASGLGMAFLARVDGDEKYRKAADKVYSDYLKVKRTDNGGVTHKAKFKELWDDTIFMVGIFLLEMYELTGDEKYIDELVLQINAHREKLLDTKTGLWYHGWDGDDKNRCNLCGQTGWSNNPEKRSNELWGRGNGWVVVTLSKAIRTIAVNHPKRALLNSYLKEMIVGLPSVQDKASGHWYQLPMRPEQAGNYIESSCTAMFAYGIQVALEEGLVEGEAYKNSVKMAYEGLRTFSIKSAGGPYLSVKNVCKGTCIGDMQYYLDRKAESEKPCGLGMFLLFGRAYENGVK